MARRSIRLLNDRRPSVRNPLLTSSFALEQMTGIEPALSAWELACHRPGNRVSAGQCQFGRCPRVTALPHRSPPDRARNGHATGPAPGPLERPLTMSLKRSMLAVSTARTARRTGPVQSRRSRSRSDAAGALDWFRETSTILGRGLGSAVLPEPGRCHLWESPRLAAPRRYFAAVPGVLVVELVGTAAGDAAADAGRCGRTPRATA